MGNFYQKFYQQECRLDQIAEVLQSWLQSHLPNDTPSLVLTRPAEDFTPFWPPRSVEIVELGTESVKLRFEIRNNLSDPWFETAKIQDLTQIVADFLWIDDPQVELVKVTLGPACVRR